MTRRKERREARARHASEVERLRAELDALPEMLRLGVGGTQPPKAAKTDEEAEAALATIKALGRMGFTVYRKEGDGYVFDRHATDEEERAFIVVFPTGLAAGWNTIARAEAAEAEVARLRESTENLLAIIAYAGASPDREIVMGGVCFRASRLGPPSWERPRAPWWKRAWERVLLWWDTQGGASR